MKRCETVFDYLKQIFGIYGVTVLGLHFFCLIFGENVKEFSTLFALGNQGLSTVTMQQFFLLSTIIATLRFILFSDGLIRKVPISIRTITMFSLVFLCMIFFIYWFGWFPIDMWQPWVIFFVCFGISAGISTMLTTWKERLENKAMEEALQRLKQEVIKHD